MSLTGICIASRLAARLPQVTCVSLAATSPIHSSLGSGGVSYGAQAPPVFAAAPPEFLCKAITVSTSVFYGLK